MMVSIVAHAVAILVLVVLPLLLFHVLPESELLSWLTAPPAPPAPPPPPVPPTPVRTVAAQQVTVRQRGFFPPIPVPIPPPIGDLSVAGLTNVGVLDGILGVPYGGGLGVPPGGVIGIPTAPPAPLPLPPKPVKHAPVPVGGDVQASKLIKRVSRCHRGRGGQCRGHQSPARSPAAGRRGSPRRQPMEVLADAPQRRACPGHRHRDSDLQPEVRGLA